MTNNMIVYKIGNCSSCCGSFLVAQDRQMSDELARLTSAGREDMEHKVRNVRLRVE